MLETLALLLDRRGKGAQVAFLHLSLRGRLLELVVDVGLGFFELLVDTAFDVKDAGRVLGVPLVAAPLPEHQIIHDAAEVLHVLLVDAHLLGQCLDGLLVALFEGHLHLSVLGTRRFHALALASGAPNGAVPAPKQRSWPFARKRTEPLRQER